MLAALSLATDLGMGQPLEQALRVCLLALELGRRVGCDGVVLSDVYYLALLEHLGCTSSAPEIAALNGGDDLAFRRRGIALAHASTGEFLREFVRHTAEDLALSERVRVVTAGIVGGNKAFQRVVAAQCEGAARLADGLGVSEELRRGLSHFYERWDGKGVPGGVAGEDVSLAQRVVTVAHDAVVLSRLQAPSAALDAVGRRRTGAYDPAVCDALLADGELLLRDADGGDVWEHVLEVEPQPARTVSEEGLAGVVRGFADFADLKAPFLMGHSRAVAALAGAGARSLGCEHDIVAAVTRAGLLHDLGRVGVPNGIWEKRGALDGSERERVRLHPYYTERVLARAPVLARVAVSAGCHHERLDGSGYHRGVGAAQLPIEARLLAVADAYDAMTHARPYRPALDPARARSELRAEVDGGRLDQRAVNAVLEAAGAPPVRVSRAWPAGLSDREVEVLRLLARGKTNRQVAVELVIASKTVGRHVENIYAKTGLCTRAGAALFAAEHELLD